MDRIWVAAALLLVLGTALMWFVGAWVLPRTRDGYVRRVWRIGQGWAADTNMAYGRFLNRQAKFADRLVELSPPVELAALHDQLVSLVRDHDRLWNQPRTSTVARDVSQAERAVREAREHLCSATWPTEEQRAYASALDDMFTRRAEDYAAAAADSERATSEALQRLARIRPPDSVAADHQALTAAIQAHLDVVRVFHQASQAADPDGVAEATARWEASVAGARQGFDRVADGLDFYKRWPRPTEPRASERLED